MDDGGQHIAIESLRYVRLGTQDLSGAIDFAQRALGLQLHERTDSEAFFRSDMRAYTLAYHSGPASEQAIGLEVRGPEVLEAVVAVCRSVGLPTRRGTLQEIQERRVRDLLVISASGYDVELVVRPLQSGWRMHGSRDAGLIGFEAVAVLGPRDGSGQELWTKVLGGKVSDWIGDAAFVRFDEFHHRVAVHPSTRRGVLAVEFGVEDLDLLMQNFYFLRSAQIRVVDGPGRRPTSGQLFVTIAGPDEMLFSFVAEGERSATPRRARQFPRARGSFCSWSSDTEVPEFQ